MLVKDDKGTEWLLEESQWPYSLVEQICQEYNMPGEDTSWLTLGHRYFCPGATIAEANRLAQRIVMVHEATCEPDLSLREAYLNLLEGYAHIVKYLEPQPRLIAKIMALVPEVEPPRQLRLLDQLSVLVWAWYGKRVSYSSKGVEIEEGGRNKCQ